MPQTQLGTEKAAMAFCLKLLECNPVHRGVNLQSPLAPHIVPSSWKNKFFYLKTSSWPREISP